MSKPKTASRGNKPSTATAPKAPTAEETTDPPNAAPTGDAPMPTGGGGGTVIPLDRPTADAAPAAPEEGAEGKSETEEKPDPILVMRGEITAGETFVSEAMVKIGAAAVAQDLETVMSLTAEMSEKQGRIAALILAVARATFAVTVEELLKGLSPASIPVTGDFVVSARFTDGELISVHAADYSTIPSGKSGRKAAKRAAFTASDSGRDLRLPPAGVTVQARPSKDTPPVEVTFTDGAGVLVTGFALDGTTHFDKEPFTSVSTAAKNVCQRVRNGYRWLRLGEAGHEWNGAQTS